MLLVLSITLNPKLVHTTFFISIRLFCRKCLIKIEPLLIGAKVPIGGQVRFCRLVFNGAILKVWYLNQICQLVFKTHQGRAKNLPSISSTRCKFIVTLQALKGNILLEVILYFLEVVSNWSGNSNSGLIQNLLIRFQSKRKNFFKNLIHAQVSDVFSSARN